MRGMCCIGEGVRRLIQESTSRVRTRHQPLPDAPYCFCRVEHHPCNRYRKGRDHCTFLNGQRGKRPFAGGQVYHLPGGQV